MNRPYRSSSGTFRTLPLFPGARRPLLHLLTSYSRNHVAILYRFRDIASYLSKVADFNPPHLHLAPQLGVTRWHFAKIFSNRKIESLGYRVALLT